MDPNHGNKASSSSTHVPKRKIKIQRIEDNRSRQATFLKRKNGLFKKAMELGVLCDCEVGVIAYNAHNGKLFEYSSVDMEQVLERYASYTGPSPRRKRENFFDLPTANVYSDIPQIKPNVAPAALRSGLAVSLPSTPNCTSEEVQTPPHGSDQPFSSREASVAPRDSTEPHSTHDEH